MSGSGATTIAETSNGPSVPNSTLLPPPFDPMIAASPELAAAYQQRASLSPEELKKTLVATLEYIFSKEYLALDTWFYSQLNADSFVPITQIAELNIVRQFSKDLDLILTCLKSTDKIVVDESKAMARPSVKIVQRNTLILRDIPESTPAEEVKKLFGDFASHIVEMRPDIESTYFVKFDSEEVTTKAFLHLRSQKFNGNPVQARVKSENLLRTAFTANYNYYSTMPVYGYGLDPRAMPYSGGAFNPQLVPYMMGQNPYQAGYSNRPYDASKGSRKNFDSRRGRGGATGAQSVDGQAPRSAPSSEGGRGRGGRRGGEARPTGTRRNDRGDRNAAPAPGGAPVAAPKRSQPVEVPQGPSHFPPLGAGKKGRDVHRYSKEEVTAVLSAPSGSAPEVAPKEEVAAAFAAGTHAELESAKAIDAKMEWAERPRASSQKKNGAAPKAETAGPKPVDVTAVAPDTVWNKSPSAVKNPPPKHVLPAPQPKKQAEEKKPEEKKPAEERKQGKVAGGKKSPKPVHHEEKHEEKKEKHEEKKEKKEEEKKEDAPKDGKPSWADLARAKAAPKPATATAAAPAAVAAPAAAPAAVALTPATAPTPTSDPAPTAAEPASQPTVATSEAAPAPTIAEEKK